MNNVSWEEQAAKEILEMLRTEGVVFVHPILFKGLTKLELEALKNRIRAVLRKYGTNHDAN